MGALGAGPGPLASRPLTTKGYNWASPSCPAYEPNLGAQIQISSPSRKGIDIPQMPSPGEVLFNKGCRIGSPEERMRLPMPCHEFKIDKPSQGLAFGKYVHLKGRSSPHTRDIRPILPPIFHLKGRTSLRTRYMRHLLLSIWEEIIHFPRKVDPFPL